MLRTPASLRRLSLAVSTTSKAFDPQAGLASVGTAALLRSATVSRCAEIKFRGASPLTAES